MYLEKDGNLYVKEGDAFRNVQVTAEEKVVTVRELKSITVKPGKLVKSLDGANPLTMDEVKRKFHLDGDHPIAFAKTETKKK